MFLLKKFEFHSFAARWWTFHHIFTFRPHAFVKDLSLWHCTVFLADIAMPLSIYNRPFVVCIDICLPSTSASFDKNIQLCQLRNKYNYLFLHIDYIYTHIYRLESNWPFDSSFRGFFWKEIDEDDSGKAWPVNPTDVGGSTSFWGCFRRNAVFGNHTQSACGT